MNKNKQFPLSWTKLQNIFRIYQSCKMKEVPAWELMEPLQSSYRTLRWKHLKFRELDTDNINIYLAFWTHPNNSYFFMDIWSSFRTCKGDIKLINIYVVKILIILYLIIYHNGSLQIFGRTLEKETIWLDELHLQSQNLGVQTTSSHHSRQSPLKTRQSP